VTDGDEALLTESEAADWLGVSVAELRKLLPAGDGLHPVARRARFARQRMYDPRQVDAIAEDRRRKVRG
jgi:hypothetical protein